MDIKGIVAIALSGGADSTCAALVLKDRGVDLLGLHMVLPVETAKEALHAAREVAARLEISLEVIDLREPFKELVLAPFLAACSEGKTPNPCVVCNLRIKFGALLDEALRLGASRVATGHYARLRTDETGKLWLTRGKDRDKDQSYFLYRVDETVLKRLVFPLGGLTRDETLAKLKAAGLSKVVLPTSQDLCFLGPGSLGDFLRAHLDPELFSEGPIIDLDGNVIGTHRGLFNYTVGQRRGINVPGKEPYYVLRLEPEANRLVVGSRKDLLAPGFLVDEVVWREEKSPDEAVGVEVKIRYAAAPVAASLKTRGQRLEVKTERPVDAVTPGQAAVFYRRDRVLGGGVIRCALP